MGRRRGTEWRGERRRLLPPQLPTPKPLLPAITRLPLMMKGNRKNVIRIAKWRAMRFEPTLVGRIALASFPRSRLESLSPSHSSPLLLAAVTLARRGRSHSHGSQEWKDRGSGGPPLPDPARRRSSHGSESWGENGNVALKSRVPILRGNCPLPLLRRGFLLIGDLFCVSLKQKNASLDCLRKGQRKERGTASISNDRSKPGGGPSKGQCHLSLGRNSDEERVDSLCLKT